MDYIIIKKDNTPLTFEDGQIIVYGNKEEAEADRKEGETIKTIPRYLSEEKYDINSYLKATN